MKINYLFIYFKLHCFCSNFTSLIHRGKSIESLSIGCSPHSKVYLTILNTTGVPSIPMRIKSLNFTASKIYITS